MGSHYIYDRLPIGPFREWLREECARVVRRNDIKEEHAPLYVGLATGLGSKQVRFYLDEAADVSLRVVDRVLCRHGGATARDLYPSEFEHNVIPIGNHKGRCGICGTELQRAAPTCGFCLEQEKGLAA